MEKTFTANSSGYISPFVVYENGHKENSDMRNKKFYAEVVGYTDVTITQSQPRGGTTLAKAAVIRVIEVLEETYYWSDDNGYHSFTGVPGLSIEEAKAALAAIYDEVKKGGYKGQKI